MCVCVCVCVCGGGGVYRFPSMTCVFNQIDVNVYVNNDLGLTTRQPLWVIWEKRDRRDSRGDEREGQGRKRNRNESEETEEIRTFLLYPYLLQG